jgi:hypothetical protein
MPAYALMAAGGLYFLWILYLIGSTLFGFAVSAGLGGGGSTMGWLFSGLGLVVQILFSLAFGGGIIYGAMQMKNLRNYNFALVASILSILPCTYCCCATIPIGVWALVVLLKPEVKAAFQQGPGGFPVNTP